MSFASMTRAAAATLSWALVATPSALAQRPQLELVPYVGAFIPLADLSDQPLSSGGSTLERASQTTSLAVGGRAVLWLAGPVGLEGTLLYAPSEAEATVDGETSSEGAFVWAGAGRLLLKLGVSGAPVVFIIDGGIALIGRGGDVFDGLSGATNLGGVAGLAGRFGLSDIFAIRIDAESYLYSVQLRGEESGQMPMESESSFQSDLVVSAGLVIALGA